jgi:NAD(P)-dependent dehydrogenase (short-subunit alcohol dehydrogenase family)
MSKPGTGYYSMTKYAVEALNEALAEEVAPLGIKVTALEAGPFRTRWAGSSIQRTTTPIAAYADTVHARADLIAQMDGKQAGDPVRAARAVVDLVRCENPPLQLLMGRIALDTYREKLKRINASLDEWEDVTLGMDYPTE